MWEKVLQEINIGNFKLQNPVVFGPHRLNFPEGHLPGYKRIAFYEERAKGNVGMIVTESAMVLRGEYPYDWALNVYEKGATEAFAKLSAAIHKYNTVAVASLNLQGMQGDSSVTRKPLLAPSAVAEVNSNEIPKVIDIDDIEEIKAGFKYGAEVMVAAGFDGVEINAGQYALLRQFLSGLTNFRADEYGGSLENKCRLLVDVLRDAKAVLGDEKILGLRLCVDEYAPWGGIQPVEAKAIAEYIVKNVKLNYIAFENGGIFSTNMTMAGYNQPEDYALAAATEAGSDIDVPLGVGGSLVSLESIEKALNSFQLVDLTRTLIADPEFINKVKSGNTEAIVPCILCKEGCYTQVNTNPVVACSMNPIAGEEYRFKPLKAFGVKKLAVVGSGPAGLMATLTVLKVGYSVDLFEKSGFLGGHFQEFSDNFNSSKPAEVLKYFVKNFAEYESSGNLKILLNREFKANEAPSYDAVIVATGADYKPAVYNGDVKVLSVDDVLAGKIPEGSMAAVEDTLGDNRGITVCRILKNAGYDITLVTHDAYFLGKMVKIGEFSQWYGEMAALGITEKTHSRIGYAGKNKLEIINKYTEKSEILPGVDIVVRVETPQVNNVLWNQLADSGVMRILVGDAVAPRNLQAAIREGYFAIKELR